MGKLSAYPLRKVFRFEKGCEQMASVSLFLVRIIAMFLVAALLTSFVLFIGSLGFHHWAQLSWLDGFYNSSMILSGMGVINSMSTATTKIFASVYALFCGLMFSVIIGLIFVPVAHRIYHKLHFDRLD